MKVLFEKILASQADWGKLGKCSDYGQKRENRSKNAELKIVMPATKIQSFRSG